MVTTTTTEVLTKPIKREAAMTLTWTCPPASSKEKTLAARDRREYFMRSASLDRLRRFPAYVCTRSSQTFPNVLLFLNAALTAVQAGLKSAIRVAQKYLLLATILAAMAFLLLEVGFCVGALVAGAKPLGLLFMVGSLMLMAVIALRTMLVDDPVARKYKKC